MDDKSIAFITCVNDDTMYEESMLYIDKLIIPKGYKIEKIDIRESKSITSAYNEAIWRSKSKYKIYLHQDTLIINKEFLIDILNIFSKDEKIGLLGVIGTKSIPSNGIWWESGSCCGKVYDSSIGRIRLIDYPKNNENNNEYTEVKAIDGIIMITQYDVKWNEEIFKGWHFYDLSQSVEFSKAGYKIVIPKQNNPWCLHACGIANVKNGYEEYRQVFLNTYEDYIF